MSCDFEVGAYARMSLSYPPCLEPLVPIPERTVSSRLLSSRACAIWKLLHCACAYQTLILDLASSTGHAPTEKFYSTNHTRDNIIIITNGIILFAKSDQTMHLFGGIQASGTSSTIESVKKGMLSLSKYSFSPLVLTVHATIFLPSLLHFPRAIL